MIDIQLSDDEQNVINTIYQRFRSNNKWPVARVIRKELGRKTVESVVARKEPQLIQQKFEEDRIECYKLTFNGVLVCPEAKDDVQMILQYIDFLKKKFHENPEIQEVTSTEVKESLKLSKEQSIRLSHLIIDLGHLYGKGASSGGNEWKAGVPDDIEDIAEANSSEEYLKKRLKKEDERQKELEKFYSEKKVDRLKLLSWLSFNVNLWLASYIAIAFSKKTLPIIIVVIIWFFLFSLSRVLEEVFGKKIPFFSSEKVLDKIIWWIITIFISGIGGVITKILTSE